MSLQGTIKRYTLIIEKLQNNHYPTSAVLLDYLHDNDFGISERSLQRDFSAIRNEFGIDIKYHQHRKGYFIDKDNTLNFETFIRFLEIVNTSDLLMETIRDGKETLSYISFEAEGTLKGIQQIKQLLKAIKERKRISFKHFNFHTNKTKNYNIEPYLLKQYQNRWYVVGKVKGIEGFRTFGIDRIEDLTLANEKFSRDKKIDIQDLFSKVVGLTFSNDEPEIVKIEVNYPQANYFKTLPLHTSQTIDSETKESVVFSLYVIPNFELIQKIMIHVEWAKVLEPKWVADDIRGHLKKMLNNYK